MKRCKYPVVWAAALAVLVCALPNTVMAFWGDPTVNLSAASEEYQNALKSLASAVDRSPSKVDSSKWSTTREAAVELKRKVGELRFEFTAANRASDRLVSTNSGLESRLDVIQMEFERLAEEAGQQTGLPAALASAAKRERTVWMAWAKVAEESKTRFAQIAEQLERKVAELGPVDSILGRLDRGADRIIELASIGEQLDEQTAVLATMSDQINGIIDVFGSLADQARDALTRVGPNNLARIASPDSPYRVWRDREGRQVVARLVNVQGGRVQLQVQGSSTLRYYRLEQLSDADRGRLQQSQGTNLLALR